VDVLETPGEQQIRWFDAPFAPWRTRTSEIPGVIPETFLGSATWHFVEETGTWYGTPSPMPERPLVIDEPHVAVATVHAGTWLFWQGVPLPEGHRVGVKWRGEYVLWLEAEADVVKGGTWSSPRWGEEAIPRAARGPAGARRAHPGIR
jgi:hypothetical protein